MTGGWTTLALALAVGLAVAPCAPACATVPPSATTGVAAPSLAFALADGSELRSETTRGDVVVLAFFTKWCPASASMLRALEGIRAANQDVTGLTVLAIDEGDEPSDVAALFAKLGIQVKVAFDRGGAVATRLGLPTVPSVLLVDRGGIVQNVHAGYHGSDDGTAIANEVAALLSAPRVP